MTDYEKLIDGLKYYGNTYAIGDNLDRAIYGADELMLDAATAIETLIAERDAAIEELRGICWCCVHGKKWYKAPKWSNMVTCEHMKELGALACSGRNVSCKYWEWRGPRKESGEPNAQK